MPSQNPGFVDHAVETKVAERDFLHLPVGRVEFQIIFMLASGTPRVEFERFPARAPRARLTPDCGRMLGRMSSRRCLLLCTSIALIVAPARSGA